MCIYSLNLSTNNTFILEKKNKPVLNLNHRTKLRCANINDFHKQMESMRQYVSNVHKIKNMHKILPREAHQ